MRHSSIQILNELKSMAAKGKLAGMFADIPNDVYHAGPGISSSQLKPIISRMNDLDYETPNASDAMRVGTAFHTMVLEPKIWSEEWKVSMIPDAHGQHVTPAEFDLLKRMKSNFFANPDVAEAMKGASHEVTFYHTCSETGVLQKVRMDIIKTIDGIPTPYDVKTTRSVSTREFSISSRKYLYRISAAYYLKVLAEHFGFMTLNDFFLIGSEKEHSQRSRIFRISPRSLSEGSTEVKSALKMIERLSQVGPSAWDEYENKIREISI